MCNRTLYIFFFLAFGFNLAKGQVVEKSNIDSIKVYEILCAATGNKESHFEIYKKCTAEYAQEFKNKNTNFDLNQFKQKIELFFKKEEKYYSNEFKSYQVKKIIEQKKFKPEAALILFMHQYTPGGSISFNIKQSDQVLILNFMDKILKSAGIESVNIRDYNNLDLAKKIFAAQLADFYKKKLDEKRFSEIKIFLDNSIALSQKNYISFYAYATLLKLSIDFHDMIRDFSVVVDHISEFQKLFPKNSAYPDRKIKSYFVLGLFTDVIKFYDANKGENFSGNSKNSYLMSEIIINRNEKIPDKYFFNKEKYSESEITFLSEAHLYNKNVDKAVDVLKKSQTYYNLFQLAVLYAQKSDKINYKKTIESLQSKMATENYFVKFRLEIETNLIDYYLGFPIDKSRSDKNYQSCNLHKILLQKNSSMFIGCEALALIKDNSPKDKVKELIKKTLVRNHGKFFLSGTLGLFVN